MSINIFEKMQQETYDLLQKIHHHDFNVELAKGTLHQDNFIFYLIQDALYLNDYARALSIVAARLPNNNHMHEFTQFALDAIKSERELHINYLNKFNKNRQNFLNLDLAEKSPACFMYTNYLLKNASLASIEQAAASLLPCFFIYNEVGKKMQSYLYSDHPYYDWIALYSHTDFEQSVITAINIINQLADNASPATHKDMIQAFYKATQLEWLFWDSAYKKENWVI